MTTSQPSWPDPSFPRKVLAALAVILLLISVSTMANAAVRWYEDPEQYRWVQGYMLELINEERSANGLSTLRLDSLASQLARQHAAEMLAGEYLSHWNLAGQKPTRRYNLLGGFHALSENIFTRRGSLPDWRELVELQMDVLMASDGHRAAILDPDKTHVGLGFAVADDRFYASQEFITQLGGEYRSPLSVRIGETVEFSGRFDPAHHSFAQLLVSFEDPEQPRTRKWLENTESYRDGDKLIAGYTADPNIEFSGLETFHSVAVDQSSGTFRAQVNLDYKGKPGMYYLLLWFNDNRTGESILAASVAVAVSR